MTLKLDDNGCCRIHSVSDDGNGWIVTNERYVVMPWKMVTKHGKKRQLIVYLVKKNPRLKSSKEERERKKILKRSVKNIMKHI